MLGMGQYDKAIAALSSGAAAVARVGDRTEPAGRGPLGEEPRPRAPAGLGRGRRPKPRRRLELLNAALKARRDAGSRPDRSRL